MPQPDKIKRAVAEKLFDAFDTDANVYVFRSPSPQARVLDELKGEIVDSGDLYRTLRLQVGNAPRYFELRVKELM